jgi:hypothetical protein
MQTPHHPIETPTTGKGKKRAKPVNKDRFISKMFLRGDSGECCAVQCLQLFVRALDEFLLICWSQLNPLPTVILVLRNIV